MVSCKITFVVISDYNNQNYQVQPPEELERGPECDNPECLCNLKKEPEERPPDNGSCGNID